MEEYCCKEIYKYYKKIIKLLCIRDNWTSLQSANFGIAWRRILWAIQGKRYYKRHVSSRWTAHAFVRVDASSQTFSSVFVNYSSTIKKYRMSQDYQLDFRTSIFFIKLQKIFLLLSNTHQIKANFNKVRTRRN